MNVHTKKPGRFRQLAFVTWILLAFGLILFGAACGSTTDEETVAPTIEVRINTPTAVSGEASSESESGYPAPATESPPARAAGYPGPISTPEGVLDQPPDPERDLPEAADESGVLGGVLVRELLEGQYLPVEPQALYLAEIVTTNDGTPVYMRHNSESHKAEIYNTGVFIFVSVPPGEYGLVVDIGIGQFPVTDENGAQIIHIVEAGEASDIGQVFVPNLGTQ